MSLSNNRGTSLGFRASACVLASAAIVLGSGANAQPDRPNVVFMLADDLGYGSVSWYGSDIPTPNIDSVAHNGVGFVSGYVTAPVCNPSRPALMTGRYQQRWGKELNSQTVPPEGAVGYPRCRQRGRFRARGDVNHSEARAVAKGRLEGVVQARSRRRPEPDRVFPTSGGGAVLMRTQIGNRRPDVGL